METTQAATAWQLSAPESFVLLNGPSADGAEAFKLGVLELVTRKALKIVHVEESGMFGRRKQTAVLVEGSGGSVPDGRALRSIWELYQQQKQRTFKDGTVGVPVADLAGAASRRFKTLGKYVEQEVLPPLVDQGLYAREERRTLGIFRSTRHTLTPDGEAARDDLRSRMTLAEQEFAGWVRTDPTRAMAFAGLAGAALLLMPALYPELQQMAGLLRPGDSEGDDVDDAEDDDTEVGAAGGEGLDLASADAGGLDSGGLDLGGADLGGFDMGTLSSLDFSAFDSIDDAFSAIDAGVDSADGDSGGGDGGGDGGGSD